MEGTEEELAKATLQWFKESKVNILNTNNIAEYKLAEAVISYGKANNICICGYDDVRGPGHKPLCPYYIKPGKFVEATDTLPEPEDDGSDHYPLVDDNQHAIHGCVKCKKPWPCPYASGTNVESFPPEYVRSLYDKKIYKVIRMDKRVALVETENKREGILTKWELVLKKGDSFVEPEEYFTAEELEPNEEKCSNCSKKGHCYRDVPDIFWDMIHSYLVENVTATTQRCGLAGALNTLTWDLLALFELWFHQTIDARAEALFYTPLADYNEAQKRILFGEKVDPNNPSGKKKTDGV